eukprot:TRINITY_DN880_c1_g1_i1.p2 TRINITY_DN880_c1_g1~~TRINITY_DN880_c1_g1_i1.p2  ORF type:complete len:52 (+),score=3.32 TRINITY_DN880_c1_g1_i1:887-1042(+)
MGCGRSSHSLFYSIEPRYKTSKILVPLIYKTFPKMKRHCTLTLDARTWPLV